MPGFIPPLSNNGCGASNMTLKEGVVCFFIAIICLIVVFIIGVPIMNWIGYNRDNNSLFYYFKEEYLFFLKLKIF